LLACEHVRAHQRLEDIADPDDYDCAKANHEADELAVESRQKLHPAVDEGIKQRLDDQLSFQKKYIQMIGELFCFFPRPERTGRQRQEEKQEPRAKKEAKHHSWVKVPYPTEGRVWTCKHCLKVGGSSAPHDDSTCTPSRILRSLLEQTEQHQIQIALMQGDSPLYICAACGLFAHKCFRKLRAKCKPASSRGKHNKRRVFENGWHPVKKLRARLCP
jgi:hypothetical protein